MRTRAAAALIALFLAEGECRGITPYENIALPQGLYFSTYPLYYSASKLTDKHGKTVANNFSYKTYQDVLRLTYYNKTLFPNTWIATAMLPVGTKEMLGRRASGVGDLSLAAGYWLIDDPQKRTWLGAGSYIDIPVGNYSRDRAVNMGDGTWKFKPTIVFAKQTDKLDVELTLKYTVYTQNMDTGIREGNATDGEAHIGYFVRKNVLLGGVFTASFGRDSVVKGRKIPDSGVMRFQAGPSVFRRTKDGLCITIQYLPDIEARNTLKGHLIVIQMTWKL